MTPAKMLSHNQAPGEAFWGRVASWETGPSQVGPHPSTPSRGHHIPFRVLMVASEAEEGGRALWP